MRGQTLIRKHGAFTLIELLVSISIIALLIAMLLPALRTARSASRSVMCMSNLRQGMIGFHAYRADHRQYAPALMRSSSQPDGWIHTLEPYTGGRFGEIQMRCPEAAARESLENVLTSPEAFTYAAHFSYPTANARVPFLFIWPSQAVNFEEIEGRSGFIFADGTSYGGFRSRRTYSEAQILSWAATSWRHNAEIANFAMPDGSVRGETMASFFDDDSGQLWRRY